MLNKFISHFSFIAALSIVMTSSVYATCEKGLEDISIALSLDNAPWTLNPDNKSESSFSGYAAEHIAVVLKEHCLKPKFRYMVPARIVASIQSDQIDGGAVASNLSNPQPPEGTVCSSSYLSIPWGLFSVKNPQHKTAAPDLVGVLRVIGFDLSHRPENVSTFTTSKLLYRSLKAGRVGSVISNPETANYWAEQLDTEIEAVKLMGTASIRFCFSKNRLPHRAELLAKEFTPAIYRLRENQPQRFSAKGRELIDKYSIYPQSPSTPKDEPSPE